MECQEISVPKSVSSFFDIVLLLFMAEIDGNNIFEQVKRWKIVLETI